MTGDPQPPKYLWYGDDFTGASDTLATFANAGLKALLCLGVPDQARLEAIGPLDALGIAGAARSMSPDALHAELQPVGRYARDLHIPILHYKCCSTFDSSPTTGSLGQAVKTLRNFMPNPLRAIVGGQPSLGRYCAFGNLFAAAGTGGEIFRIDRHPTMAHHPVTPMSEADLRLHLQPQGLDDIALIDWSRLATATDEEFDAHVDDLLKAEGGRTVLFDALEPLHLQRIGAQLWRRALSSPLLVVGASSVAEAVIAHWRALGLASAPQAPIRVGPAQGPVFVLAGSQSVVTARQIEIALSGGTDAPYQDVALDIASIVTDGTAIDRAAEQCASLLRQGRSVIAHTGRVVDSGPSQLAVAQAGGRLLADVLLRVPAVRRVGVAGGDTSSLAVEALGIWALGFTGTLSPGVTIVSAHADDRRVDGLELMLKGGQMGAPDLFQRLLAGNR